MRSILNFSLIRNIMWRLGRKIYTYARGDGLNDPGINGEYWLLQHLLNASSSPQLLFDVGANKGNWTAQALSLSQYSKKRIHIHAFEPSQATRSMLTARFVGNETVAVWPYALAATVGVATFFSEEEGGGTNSLSPTSGLKAEVVALNTVDQFMQQIGVKAILMLKVDTEGFDLLVLKGAEKSLSDGIIELIQFEYNWRWLLNHACLRDVFELIADKPYRLGKLVGNSIEFYDQWHFELDRFFENNYVLIRKDSKLCKLGTEMYFDNSNTVTIGRFHHR